MFLLAKFIYKSTLVRKSTRKLYPDKYKDQSEYYKKNNT